MFQISALPAVGFSVEGSSFPPVLNGYRGTVVADGFAVYDVLAREGPTFTLAHYWSHAEGWTFRFGGLGRV
jgi:hypothetical protein